MNEASDQPEPQADRPAQHGGGEASAPIAGDTSSFPSDAELSRTLVEEGGRATLSTLTDDGYPYGSGVSYAVDAEGAPVLLMSGMAEHTVNVKGDSRVSLLVSADVADADDPLASARLTLVGELELLNDPGESRERYLAVHPYAAYYADFTDFGFWRLDVRRCRFIGGFGHMSWVDAERYAAAVPDPIGPAAGDIVAHMNDDHRAANLAYVQKLAGLDSATEATMVGVDRHGITLQADTPEGPRMARIGFDTTLTGPDEARAAVIALLDKARSV